MPKSRQARRLCSLVAIVAAHFLLALPAAAITPPKLITQALDETRLFTLQGNTHPAMRAENDRGRVDDSLLLAHLQLQLQRSPEQEQALKQLIDQQHDPASPNYHRWLTPTTFGSQYGLAKEDIKTITGWLASHGMTVHSVHPSSMVIDFSATAGQIRNTFKTEIHSLLVAGVPHIANASDPQIPAALAPAVAGVVSMHDFTPRTKKWPQNQFTVGTGGTYNITPADLATIYNLNPLFNGGYSGQGQTITIIMDSNLYSVSDWTTFRSTFGLSSYTAGSFTTIHPAAASGTNNCNDPGVTASDGESIVDAEWASAAAPSAAIVLASCANNGTYGGLIAIQNLVNSNNPPAILTLSTLNCEAFHGAANNAAYASAYQQGASEGVSIFVSSGDDGAASCDPEAKEATHGIGVNALASTPYNVAVGGTDFGDTYAKTNGTYWNTGNSSTFGSAKSYVPEIAWNDSCASVMLATFISGSGTTYGTSGFCNSSTGTNSNYHTTWAGGGGPSGCATGNPQTAGIVGGTCKGYAKPSWQSGVVGIPSDGVRDLPDVSLFAGNGYWGHSYVHCWSNTSAGGRGCSGDPSGWNQGGGTSVSTPIMAAIQALVNQKAGGKQGNPNYVYYKLAAAEHGSSGNANCSATKGNGIASTCTFNDITQGDIDVVCTSGPNCYKPSGTNGVLSTSTYSYAKAYGATTGWDFATGLGSVNAYNLVNNWSSVSSGNTAPAAPTGLSVSSVTQSSAALSWSASSGASSYNVYRNSSKVGSSTSTSYTDSGLTSGTTYSYTVTAVNSSGESAKSGSVNATTSSGTAYSQAVSATDIQHYSAKRITLSQYSTLGAEYGYSASFTLYLCGTTWTNSSTCGPMH